MMVILDEYPRWNFSNYTIAEWAHSSKDTKYIWSSYLVSLKQEGLNPEIFCENKPDHTILIKKKVIGSVLSFFERGGGGV